MDASDFNIDEWNYICPRAYQAEVVWLLQWELEKNGGKKKAGGAAGPGGDENKSAGCSIL